MRIRKIIDWLHYNNFIKDFKEPNHKKYDLCDACQNKVDTREKLIFSIINRLIIYGLFLLLTINGVNTMIGWDTNEARKRIHYFY